MRVQDAKNCIFNGLFLQKYDIIRNSKDVASVSLRVNIHQSKFNFSSVCPFKTIDKIHNFQVVHECLVLKTAFQIVAEKEIIINNLSCDIVVTI